MPHRFRAASIHCLSALLLFLILCVASSVDAEAQGRTAMLRGFVTDQSDGQSLPGVHVSLEDDDGLLFGAISDRNGLYVITRLPAGRYTLRASFVGYRTLRDTLELADGETRTLAVSLVPDEAELDEVFVEAEREGGAVPITTGMQTIRPQDIRRIPAPDVSADLVSYLTMMPGVITTGDRGGQLFIRGGEPSHTLTLVDGMYVFQPFHILGFYSAFPADVLSSADVHAGGFGSRFTGRISSVIDVYTRSGNKRAFRPAVTAAPFMSTALLEGPLVRDKVSVLASARISTIEQMAAQYVNTPLPYRFGDFFGKVHAIVADDHQASFSVLHTYDSGSLDGAARRSDSDEIRWNNTAYGFRYLILPSSIPILGEVLFSVSRLQTELGPPGEPRRTSSISGFNAAINVTQFAGRSQVDWGFFLRSPELDATLGGLYQNLASSYDRSPNFGIYFEPDFAVRHDLRIRPGVAGQLLGQKGFFLEPRLRAVWERGPHQVSAAGGFYRQDIVGLNDRRDATNVFTAWTDTPLGVASRATHALMGYRITPAPWIDVSIEGFHKRLSSLYISEWTAFPRFTTRLQEASGRASGMDLRLEVRGRRFYGFVNYGLSFVTYEAMQENLVYWMGSPRVEFRPPHDRRHQVNALLSTTIHEVEMSVRWSFGSGLPYTQVRGFDGFILMNGPVNLFEEPGMSRVIYDHPFGGVLPTYHRLDVSVERTFRLPRSASLTLQGAVINAYNRTNLFALDLFTLQRTDQIPVIPTIGVKLGF